MISEGWINVYEHVPTGEVQQGFINFSKSAAIDVARNWKSSQWKLLYRIHVILK